MENNQSKSVHSGNPQLSFLEDLSMDTPNEP